MNEGKNVFLHSLPREEQLGMLFDIYQTLQGKLDKFLQDDRSERAKLQKRLIEMEGHIKYLQGELAGIGRRRDKTLTTSDKVNLAVEKRFAILRFILNEFVIPITRQVLTAIVTIIILAQLYFAFGGKIPTP